MGLSAQTTASTFTLTGTEAALSSYLGTAGNLVFNGSVGSYTLTVRAQLRDGSQNILAETVELASVSAQQNPTLGASPSASTDQAPAATLVLPATLTVLSTNGQLTLPPNALGVGTHSTNDVRSVVLSVSGGSLSVAADASVGLSSALSADTVTLTGTEAALSAYLATADKLRFTGAATSHTLTVSAQVLGGGGLVRSATTAVANLSAIELPTVGVNGTATAPVISALPGSLMITPGSASLLVFTGADLDDGNTAGDDSLVLTLGVDSGTLSASSGGSVTVGGTATARTLSGTAANLEAFLQGNSLSYSGPAGTLSLSLARAAAPNGAAASTTVALQAAGTQTLGGSAVASLVLPAAVNTTPGVSAALPFGTTPVVAAGPVTLALSASGASLSWAGDANLKASSAGDALAISSGSGTALSLYGTAEQINAYLAAGKVKASGNGTVSATINGQSTGITGGTSSANVIAVSTVTGTATTLSLPTLNLPSAMTVFRLGALEPSFPRRREQCHWHCSPQFCVKSCKRPCGPRPLPVVPAQAGTQVSRVSAP